MMDSGGTEGGSPQLLQALQAQQQAQSGHGAHGGGIGGGLPPTSSQSHGAPSGGMPGAAPHATPPREVGTITEELITRPMQDVGDTVKSWFNVNEWFGIKSTDTPEQQQQKQELHSRYQQLTGEQQQHFQARLQKEHQRKARMAEEDQAAASRKQAEAAAALPEPSSPNKGPGSDMQSKKKSHKQTMTNSVTQNRQSFNKVQSSG